MQSVWKHFTNVAKRRQICSSAVSHSVCQTHPKTDLCFQFFQKSVWKYSWRSVSAKPAETRHPRWSAGTRVNHVQICRKHYWSDLANSWLTDHVCLIHECFGGVKCGKQHHHHQELVYTLGKVSTTESGGPKVFTGKPQYEIIGSWNWTLPISWTLLQKNSPLVIPEQLRNVLATTEYIIFRYQSY